MTSDSMGYSYIDDARLLAMEDSTIMREGMREGALDLPGIFLLLA
jgi:hypothetical protein